MVNYPIPCLGAWTEDRVTVGKVRGYSVFRSCMALFRPPTLPASCGDTRSLRSSGTGWVGGTEVCIDKTIKKSK